MTDSTAPSLNSCRAIRQRLAPRAARIASSRAAPRRTHQQQVRDVDACDQQNDEHAALQQIQGQPNVPDELFAKPRRQPGKTTVPHVRGARGHTVHETGDDRLHLGVELFDGRAFAETPDHHAELASPLLVRSLRGRKGKRYEQGRIPPCRPRHLEVGRQNADDDVLSGIQVDRPADDVAIRAEAGRPGWIGQDGEPVGARRRVRFHERPTQERSSTERREEGRGHRQRGHLLGAARNRQAGVTVRQEGGILERRRIGAPIEVIRDRHVATSRVPPSGTRSRRTRAGALPGTAADAAAPGRAG